MANPEVEVVKYKILLIFLLFATPVLADGANLTADINTIGLLHYEEGTGSITTDEAFDYVGELGAGVTWETGFIGENSTKFHGHGVGGNITFPASTNWTPENFTFEAWINPDALPTAGVNKMFLYSVYEPTNALYVILEYVSPTEARLKNEIINGFPFYETVAGGTIVANQWQHIATTYNTDDDVLRIYINGTEITGGLTYGAGGGGNAADGIFTQGIPTINANLTIGALSDPNGVTVDYFAFNGTMDEVRFSNITRDEFNVTNGSAPAGGGGNGTITVTLHAPTNGQSFLTTDTIDLNLTITNTTEIDTCWYDIDGETTIINSGTGVTPYTKDANTTVLFHAETGSGTNLIDSGDNYNGTLRGNAGWTAGKVGTNAIAFDGVDGTNVTLPDGVQWSPPDFTFEAWVNPNSTTGIQVLYMVAISGKQTVVRMNGADLEFILLEGGGADLETVTASGVMSTGTWQHVAVTYNNLTNNMTVYHDGDAISSSTAYTAARMPSIMGSGGLGVQVEAQVQFYNGSMDEVRVSDIARTSFNLDTAAAPCSLNTTFTKSDEVGSFPVTVFANTTNGTEFNDSVTISTDAFYQIGLQNFTAGPIANFSMNISANGNTLSFESNSDDGFLLFVNASQLESVFNNSISFLAITDQGNEIFNQTITNETLVFNVTFVLTPRLLYFDLVNEDTITGLENVTVTVINDDLEELGVLQHNNSGSYNITAGFFGDVTVRAESGSTVRRYYITLDPLVGQTNLTIWFPTTSNVYTFAVSSKQTTLPIQGAIVTLQRFLNGSTETVGQGKTLVDGTTEIPAKEGVEHTLIASADTCTTSSSDYIPSATPSVQFAIPLSCGASTTVESNYLPFINNAVYSCTNTTNSINCTIDDPTSLMTGSQLIVKKQNVFSWDDLCDVTNSSNPAELNCALGDTTNSTYWLVLKATLPEGDILLLSQSLEFGSIVVTYGLFGIFIMFMLFLALAAVGTFNPSVAVIMSGLAMIGGYMFGLLPIPIEAFLGIMVVIGIITFMMKT